MDMRALVGRNVAHWRKTKGLTQEDLSERSGFGQNYISSLERGRRNPTIITLFELARALDVNPVDLITPRLANED
jgi:transcriptional regulator with XRE-family HTH domain